jgi:large subunit ribosomal protein L29
MARKSTPAAELTDDELFERLAAARQELFNLRFQHATGSLEQTNRLAESRRDVARLLTELRAREIAAAEALAESQEHA